MDLTAEFEFIGGVPPWAGEVEISAIDPVTGSPMFASHAAFMRDGGIVDENHAAISALPNTVEQFDTFNLMWLVSYTGDTGNLRNAGTTSNQLYVLLHKPTYGTTLYHTLAHVGTLGGQGNSTDVDVLNGIWSLFATLTVYRASDLNHVMTYSHPAGATTLALLQTGKGQCGAWGDFQQDTLRTQGIWAQSVTVTPDPAMAPPPVLLLYSYDPTNSGFEVGAFPAQGNPFATYDVRNFYDHVLVTCDAAPNDLFDPSYGMRFSQQTLSQSLLLWENQSIVRFRDTYKDTWGGIDLRWRNDTKGVLETRMQ